MLTSSKPCVLLLRTKHSVSHLRLSHFFSRLPPQFRLPNSIRPVDRKIFSVRLNRLPSGTPTTFYATKNEAAEKSRSSAPVEEDSGWAIMKEMAAYVWPKGETKLKARVVTSLTLLIGAKVLNVASPLLYKRIVDGFNSGTALLTFDNPVSSTLTIGTALILAYGGARFGAALCDELKRAVFAKVAQHSVRKIARNVFLHLHSLDLNFHLSRQTGSLSKALDRGTRGINTVLTALAWNLFPTAVEVGLVTGMMAYQGGPEFAYLTLGCIASYSAFTLLTTQWRTKFRIQMNRADNEAGNRALDSLINYETVKYFNNEKFEAEGYEKLLADYERASLKTSTSLGFLNAGQNAIISFSVAASMLLSANAIAAGTMTVGDLVMINALLFQLSFPLNFLGSVYRDLKQSTIDMQTMFNLLTHKSAITNSPNSVTVSSEMLEKGSPAITFDNVWFGYTPEQSILRGLSLSVPEGKKVAIVGGSGSGKSTIVRLLYRFYDPQQGSISLAGQDIRNTDLESLRKLVAVVPQDCVLFHNTLYYNILYGNVDATEMQVIEAARMADLHDAVERMPRKYETIVGERGLKLSGGEKQRLAIARAFLKHSPIIVYDEATSSLDALTEETILKSLKRTVRQKTSLFIAHRLATIVDADSILVLEGGRIVEEGTHDSLLRMPDSRYKKLWDSQHRFYPKEEGRSAKS